MAASFYSQITGFNRVGHDATQKENFGIVSPSHHVAIAGLSRP